MLPPSKSVCTETARKRRGKNMLLHCRRIERPSMAIRILTLLALVNVAVPAAELLVLNKEEAALVFIDPGTSKILGRAATGQGPHELVLSSDGKLAFASNYGTATTPGGSISVFDTASKKVL